MSALFGTWCAIASCVRRDYSQLPHTRHMHAPMPSHACTRTGTRTSVVWLTVTKHGMCCCSTLCSLSSNGIGAEGAAALAAALPRCAALRELRSVLCLRVEMCESQHCALLRTCFCDGVCSLMTLSAFVPYVWCLLCMSVRSDCSFDVALFIVASVRVDVLAGHHRA